MIKVSVIMPVYNGERHLRQCLDSVCSQTLEEIEIICVDDGSTDSSYQILEEYRGKDDRIRLFRQQNLYAGVARNLGKANAVGEYLIFWDCDDFFELNALELMYNRAKETDADICVCGGDQYYQELEMLLPRQTYMDARLVPPADVFNRTTNEEYILNFTTTAPWNKLCRREFVEENHLDFQSVRRGNDVYFVLNALCMAQRITVVSAPLVHYRRNQGEGLTSSLGKTPLDPIYAFMDAADNLKKLGVFPERSFSNRALSNMIYLLRNIGEKDAFLSAVEFLQVKGLAAMHIREREDGYYYNKRYSVILPHLLHDTPEDFQAFLRYATYIELTEVAAKKRLADQKNMQKIADLKLKQEQLKQSWAFRIGEAIVWLPKKIRDLFKRKPKE